MTSDRSRDEAGRPRNARPRDSTGRPLPIDAVGDPTQAAEPVVTGPADALRQADLLLAEGRAFRAHEVLETQWKATSADRELWRGLAQLAVGLTHAQRGNLGGAERLLRRGAETLAPYAGSQPHGVDVDRLRSWAATADIATLGEAPQAWPRLTSG